MRTVGIALIVTIFFYVYHTQVVDKMYADLKTEMKQRQIYVYDHEAFMSKIKDQANTLILNGADINPDRFFDDQEKKLRDKLAALPPGSIVIRSEAVVQGGREVGNE